MPMKIVTYQVMACRCTGTRARCGGGPGAAGTADAPAGTVPAPVRADSLSWGSHRRAARAAGAATQPRVSTTEPPVPFHSGTLTRDPTIAPADSAVMYRPIR